MVCVCFTGRPSEAARAQRKWPDGIMQSSQIWCSVLMMTATVADRRLSPVLWFVLSLWRLILLLSTFKWMKVFNYIFYKREWKQDFSFQSLVEESFQGYFPSPLNDNGDGRYLADEDFLEGWWSVLACSLATVESDSWCTDRRVGSLFDTLPAWIWSSV